METEKIKNIILDYCDGISHLEFNKSDLPEMVERISGELLKSTDLFAENVALRKSLAELVALYDDDQAYWDEGQWYKWENAQDILGYAKEVNHCERKTMSELQDLNEQLASSDLFSEFRSMLKEAYDQQWDMETRGLVLPSVEIFMTDEQCAIWDKVMNPTENDQIKS